MLRTMWRAAATVVLLLAVASLPEVVAPFSAGPVPAAAVSGVIAFGTQTIGANVDSNPAGTAEAFPATASASGTVATVTVYVDATSTATTIVVGIYANQQGQPGALLTQATVAAPIAGSWNTVAVPAATVTSGSTYWIALLAPVGGGTIAFRDTANGSASESSSQSSLTTLPASWSAGPTWASSPVSAYVALAATSPILSVTPSSLSFGAVAGGSDPSPATLTVANTGSGTLGFTATSDSTWLTVSPSTGSAPQNVTVTGSIAGLSAGLYTGHVTVTASGAQGSPQTVPVYLSVSAPGTAGHGDWPTIEHDPARSGTATDETQLGASNVASLAPAWSVRLDGKVTAQPLFLSGVQVGGATHDVVIAATNQDTVYALDAASGAVLWRDHLLAPPSSCGVPGGFGITGTPVVDRTAGRVYAVTDDGALRTLSLADGTQAAPALALVTNPSTNYVWGGLTLVNGQLYFPTGSNGCDQAPWQGGIFDVSVAGAAPQLVTHWITVPSLPASSAGGGIWGYGGVSVDPSNGHVYAASADDATGLTGDEGYTPYAGGLLALSGGLGLLGWYQPPQPPNYTCGSAPPCDQDFAATPLVFHPPGCPAMAAAGNKNGKLYVTPVSSLEANGGYDGTHVQAIPLNVTVDNLGQGGLYGTPVYDPATNLLYVTDTGPGLTGVAGGLVALGVQADCSLAVAWSQPVGTGTTDSPNSTPTLANGVVYVGVNDGSVSAFDATSGTRLWNSGSRGFAVYAAPIVANGRLIAASWDGAAATDAGTVTAWLPAAPNPGATAPGAPTGVTALAGNQAATVSWSAPSDGGSPITSYTVTPYAGSTALAPATVTGSPPSTSTTVGGLTNGTAYTFTVSAANAVGTGPPSAASSPVTPVAVAAPVVDAKVSVNATGATATTPAFSTTHAGDTLVAFVASDGPKSGSSQTSKVSGAGLTWSLVARANAQYGTAEVWAAPAPSALTGVSVTARSAKTGYHQQLTVVAFQGSSGMGAALGASAASGGPSVTVTTTRAGSLVYAVGNDWDNAIPRTLGPNQVLAAQWVDTAVGDTFWVQSQAAAVAGAGTAVTSNDTAPTADRWNLVAVEIKGP